LEGSDVLDEDEVREKPEDLEEPEDGCKRRVRLTWPRTRLAGQHRPKPWFRP
jgi:hypothetical protein